MASTIESKQNGFQRLGSSSTDPKLEQDPIDGPSTKEKFSKPRHRASIACASCRDRRIRCVVPSGDKECMQCKRSGVECVIKNDDERRKPISRAYMHSLTERVALLESMLRARGEEPPPTNYPPKTRHSSRRSEDASTSSKAAESRIIQHEQLPRGSQLSSHDDNPYLPFDSPKHNQSPHCNSNSTESPSIPPSLNTNGMVRRLLSTRGHLSFDQLSGRLRYFGPTTNCHVHSEFGDSMKSVHEHTEKSSRADKVIQILPLQTYEYLMELFWQCYNSVIHVLHQAAFDEDREKGQTQFYSSFLHVCVLAMGFRFADKDRADIRNLALPEKGSTLHHEAKCMLDYELERRGGIPSVVALLLLGDLECGVGRDNLGWLYGGMAVRLAFDIGLHLDTRLSGLAEREIEIRQMTLWACVIYDKYWALFLGRPTSMKSSDLEIYHLSKQFERLGTCRPAGLEKSMETIIYEALIDLMELAGNITENMNPHSKGPESTIDRNEYMRMAALDRKFSQWHACLPEQLRWTPDNIATAPFSFFLLHQQYHASLILLHRPFAFYEDQITNDHDSSVPNNHFLTLSRSACTKHAVHVARIYWQHRKRFDTKKIFVTGMQHAGTAATALIAALAYIRNANDRNNTMRYLECLYVALADMAHTYQPAERMSIVLHAVMVELRSGTKPDHCGLYKPEAALDSARRDSTINIDSDNNVSQIYKTRLTDCQRVESCASVKKPKTSSHCKTLDVPTVDYGSNTRSPSLADYNELDHPHGYTMVTPSSEEGTPWPAFNEAPESLHTLSMPSTSQFSLNGRLGGMWTGAKIDDNGFIHPLANASFHETSTLNRPAREVDGMTNVDFVDLGGWGMEEV